MQLAAHTVELDDLSNELSVMLESAIIDQARLAQIEVRVSRLIDTNAIAPLSAMAWKGLIAHLHEDRIAAEASARRILASPRADSIVDINAFLDATFILFAYAHYEEVFFAIDSCIKELGNNLKILRSAIVESTVVSQFNRALNYAELYYTEDSGSDIYDSLVSEMLERREAASRLLISEQAILDRHQACVEVIRSHKFELRNLVSINLSGGEFISEYYIDASREICSEITFDLFDMLASRFESSCDDLFSIVCRPVVDYLGPGIHKDQI